VAYYREIARGQIRPHRWRLKLLFHRETLELLGVTSGERGGVAAHRPGRDAVEGENQLLINTVFNYPTAGGMLYKAAAFMG